MYQQEIMILLLRNRRWQCNCQYYRLVLRLSKGNVVLFPNEDKTVWASEMGFDEEGEETNDCCAS